MESSRPKSALLVLKEKNRAKSLTKLKNSPHAQASTKNGLDGPGLGAWEMIWDGSDYLWMIMR